MNNAKFKEFLAPLFDKIVDDLGGLREVQAMHDQLPESMIYYVAGAIHGLAIARPPLGHAWWREEAWTPVFRFRFTYEERRRLLDYVRLRIETRSGTS